MAQVKTKPGSRLTLRDRLSRLTFLEAAKLLGVEGKRLIQRGGQWEPDPADVYLEGDLFRLRFSSRPGVGAPVVTITLMAEARQRLHWNCTQCTTACEHVGAAFSLILEQKMALGLAAAPQPRVPAESLSEEELLAQALADRSKRAKEERMAIKSADPATPWTDYTVTNRTSGKSYRVALRGAEPGDSYCSCPDFRTNTLGTCKHIMHVLTKTRRRFSPAQWRKPYRRKHLALHLRYEREVTLRLLVPDRLDAEAARLVEPLVDRAISHLPDLLKRLGLLAKLGHEVTIYPDAEQYIETRQFQSRVERLAAEIRRDPQRHPLRTGLLKVPLLGYQLDGIAFAVGAGRAVLADDMGLGKTIQGVGTAELLARTVGIRKVLVICPASLKSQWRSEIHRFCDRDVQLVGGAAAERSRSYADSPFFTICNYEQVLRDILHIEQVPWDLIILDEGQRIKNWESKTSATIKSLRSRFALVLSGTPLENKLDELYSVVQFIDDRRLGPGFRFFHRHRVVDEKGRVLGYKNLGELRQALAPVLLRRTRESVKLDLPPRSVEFVRIPPSQEQRDLHDAHMQTVATIVSKKFISEMDLLRLQKALLMCRMSADSTYLVDKQPPGHSTKLAYLGELLERLLDEPDRKLILFSEWTTMLDLVEPVLRRLGADFVRLDGSVPQRQRQALVDRFQSDAGCKVFLTTNAGATGLNLQAANTVINVDLPWNPAVLEQRIARAHRMGQTQSVQVFVLVTEGTLEENLLATIAAKRDLALAALDADSDVDDLDLANGMQELKGRLEVLLGARGEAPLDETEKAAASQAIIDSAQRERVAAAGGELLGAAFKLLGELVGGEHAAPAPEPIVAQLRSRLDACVEDDPSGKPRLTISLPDRGAIDQLAQTLAKLLVVGSASAP